MSHVESTVADDSHFNVVTTMNEAGLGSSDASLRSQVSHRVEIVYSIRASRRSVFAMKLVHGTISGDHSFGYNHTAVRGAQLIPIVGGKHLHFALRT